MVPLMPAVIIIGGRTVQPCLLVYFEGLHIFQVFLRWRFVESNCCNIKFNYLNFKVGMPEEWRFMCRGSIQEA